MQIRRDCCSVQTPSTDEDLVYKAKYAAVQEIEQFVKNDVYVENKLVSDW